MSSIRIQGTVVFDSHVEHANIHPTRGGNGHLEIIFSPTNLNADQYILEYLSTMSSEKNNMTLVTSDNELAFQAKAFGVKILSVQAFLKLLYEKELHTTKAEEKPNLECRYEIQRLLDIFEKKYKDQ